MMVGDCVNYHKSYWKIVNGLGVCSADMAVDYSIKKPQLRPKSTNLLRIR